LTPLPLTRDIAGVLSLARRHLWYFVFFSVAALALRLFFVFQYPVISGDSLVYGDIAKNWLLHGVYGLTENGVARPTLIRLPGYPAFLALLFLLRGMEHYRAALLVQVFVDVASCFLITALAWMLLTPARNPDEAARRSGAAMMAFLLAALCPFTANYVALPLSETWSIFLTALIFLCAAKAVLGSQTNARQQALRWWAACGIVIGFAVMFRPDNGMPLIVIGGYVLLRFLFSRHKRENFQAGLLLLAGLLIFVVPWTMRNWRTFHVFQPLAPRYASDPGELVPRGFNRWIKTWIVDYDSVQNVYWHMDGDAIDPLQLPARAWGEEASATRQVLDQYNETLAMSPALDAEFAKLAAERVRRHPLRYYVGLPLVRIADIWLRPRIEMLPIDPDWWNFEDHEDETVCTVLLIALNFFLVLAAALGAWESRKHANPVVAWLLVGFVLVRSAFLGTLENPEPRYALECFPMVLVFAGAALAYLTAPRQGTTAATGSPTCGTES
jgi:hypothetical protein